MGEVYCLLERKIKKWLDTGQGKVEKVIDQMAISEELRVDCVTQLLVESACSWWEIVRERRSRDALIWKDFREEFEERYYSWQHTRDKNMSL